MTSAQSVTATRTRIAQGCLIVGTAGALGDTIGVWQVLGELDIPTDQLTEAFGVALDAQLTLQVGLQIGAMLVGAVGFLAWLTHVHGRISRAGGSLEVSANMAAGSFFIPILNLYLPYKALSEMWREAGRLVGAREGSATPVLAWFGLWVSSIAINMTVVRYLMRQGTISSIKDAMQVSMISGLVLTASGIAAIWLVAAFEQRLAALEGGDEDAPAAPFWGAPTPVAAGIWLAAAVLLASVHSAFLASALAGRAPVLTTRLLAQAKDDPQSYVEQFAEALDSEHPTVRAAGAVGLGAAGKAGGEHAGAVASLMRDPKPSVRAAAAGALPRLGPEGIALVVKYLPKSRTSEQIALVSALAQHKGKIEGLGAILSTCWSKASGIEGHEGMRLRMAIGEALGRHPLSPSEAVDLLVACDGQGMDASEIRRRLIPRLEYDSLSDADLLRLTAVKRLDAPFVERPGDAIAAAVLRRTSLGDRQARALLAVYPHANKTRQRIVDRLLALGPAGVRAAKELALSERSRLSPEMIAKLVGAESPEEGARTIAALQKARQLYDSDATKVYRLLIAAGKLEVIEQLLKDEKSSHRLLFTLSDVKDAKVAKALLPTIVSLLEKDERLSLRRQRDFIKLAGKDACAHIPLFWARQMHHLVKDLSKIDPRPMVAMIEGLEGSKEKRRVIHYAADTKHPAIASALVAKLGTTKDRDVIHQTWQAMRAHKLWPLVPDKVALPALRRFAENKRDTVGYWARAELKRRGH